jgi:hypothetical protein
MYQELVRNKITVPWEMANNLMILHSYTLARLHVRLVACHTLTLPCVQHVTEITRLNLVIVLRNKQAKMKKLPNLLPIIFSKMLFAKILTNFCEIWRNKF